MWKLWRTKWHGYWYFSKYFGLPLSVSFQKFSVLIFILTLLLSQGEAGAAWKTSQGYQPTSERKLLTLSFRASKSLIVCLGHTFLTLALNDAPSSSHFTPGEQPLLPLVEKARSAPRAGQLSTEARIKFAPFSNRTPMVWSFMHYPSYWTDWATPAPR